jgi:Zn-dependent peptidase ImmA (M78 family)
MSTRVEGINKNMIEWAIIRSGNSLHDFYDRFPSVKDWAEGIKNPTVKQLEDFTHKVHVPFGYLFLNKPPQEKLSFPFFRTGKENTQKVSLNIYHTIQMIQDRQNWLVDYLEDSEFPDLNFVGKFSVNDNYLQIIRDIRRVLDIDFDWAQQFSNWEQALDFLTTKIESAGIIVTFNGVVGNSTNRKINVEECRGFVLINNKAPFLFINSSDAKAAQMFTLVHELAHVWLGESAGFDNDHMLPADDPIEILCDKVAAEFLVPEIYFREKWETAKNFKYLSRIFKVSPIVIGRRALDLGLISKQDFFLFYNEYVAEIRDKRDSQPGGGDFYKTARKRVSLRFASFVNSAVKQNKILYRDAYRLTNLKGDTYAKFIKEYLY